MAPISDDSCDDNCQRALAALYTYLDGELTVERRTLITTHIEMCAPCFDQYSFETELRQVVQMRCEEKVPDALRARIADALRNELEGH